MPAQRSRPTFDAVDVALWLSAVGVVVAVLLLALGRPSPLESAFPGADKVGHFLATGTVTGLVLLAAVWRPGRGPGPFPRGAPFVILGAILGMEFLEIAQPLFSRDFQVGDIVADVLGALAAYAVWSAASHRELARKGPSPSPEVD